MIGIIIDATDGDLWLQHINDKPAIEYVIETALSCPYAHKVIVVAPMSMKTKIMGSTFRGSTVKHVKMLGRTQFYYFYDDNFGSIRGKHLAALAHELSIIIELNAHCPCVPNWLINDMIYKFSLNTNLGFYVNYNFNAFDEGSRDFFDLPLYDKGLGVIIYDFVLLAKVLNNLSDSSPIEILLSQIISPTYIKNVAPISIKNPQISLVFDNRDKLNFLSNILDIISSGKDIEEAITEVENEQV